MFTAVAIASQNALVGAYSPLTWLIAITMVFVGLVLATLLVIFAFSGRLNPWPPKPDPLPPTESAALRRRGEFSLSEEFDFETDTLPWEDDTPGEQETAPASNGSSTTPSPKSLRALLAPKDRGPRRKTGLWQLAAATLLGFGGMAACNWIDSPYGPSQTFTLGTAVALLLFIAQIVLTVQFARAQRRL